MTSTIGNPNILFLNAGTTGGISNVKDINDVSIDTFEQTWRVNCGIPPSFPYHFHDKSVLKIHGQEPTSS